MTLFPPSARALEFAELSHLRHTSPRILEARDLTNGINAVMIDCMHDVTTIKLQSYVSRALWDDSRVTSKERAGRCGAPEAIARQFTESP